MKKLSSLIAKVSILSFFFLLTTLSVLPNLSDAYAQSSTSSTSTTATSVATSTTSATANSNALVDTMCNALKLVTGNAGKAFAAFAIISLGIGFFTGKVSWGLMVGVALGIAAMFGAPTIVSALTGKDAFTC